MELQHIPNENEKQQKDAPVPQILKDIVEGTLPTPEAETSNPDIYTGHEIIDLTSNPSYFDSPISSDGVTVGRVLYYYPEVDDPILYAFSKTFHPIGPLRADVVFVNPDGTLNLIVNDPVGGAHQRTGVKFFPELPFDRQPTSFASWMDYQRKQIAKTT